MRDAGREGAGVEERSGRAQSSVAVEVIGAAMKLVAARLQNNVDNAAGVASAFRRRTGFGAPNSSMASSGMMTPAIAGDATLVHGRNVVPEIVVVDAVDLPVHLVGASAIEANRSRPPSIHRSPAGPPQIG